ncbi:MAG: S26 family signal peptidase [Deltaproteobacteria bacterium]|nr:S26 family signal peptidase [Deltaproteobacteria bacterium]
MIYIEKIKNWWLSGRKQVDKWSRKKRAIFIFLIALVIAGGALIPSRIAVTLSPSVNHRIFFIAEYSAGDCVKNGDYVMVSISSPLLENGKPQKAIKRVGCAAGDFLMGRSGEFSCYLLGNDEKPSCDGAFLGKAKEFSLKGEKLPVFSYAGVVPEGKMFLIGSHKDSYDSRYFGFVNVKDILYVAYPII